MLPPDPSVENRDIIHGKEANGRRGHSAPREAATSRNKAFTGRGM